MKFFRSVYTAGISGLLIGTMLLASPVQAATFPGENGKIAFSKTINGVTNIWRMNQNGRQQQQLTQRGARNPIWSPDGRKIAYIDVRGQLHSMRKDGSHSRQLTHESRYVVTDSPIWSPDGSYIAFVGKEKAGRGSSAIFVIQANGQRERNISGWATHGGYRAPSWAPDGRRLVYEQFGQGTGRLLVKNIVNNQIRGLTTISEGTHSHVAWSGNGKKILFSDSVNEVYTIWPDGSHRTVISDGDSRSASWSPEGDMIVFLEDDHISISQADGTITQLLIQKGAYEEIDTPSWSPDGTKLVFNMSATSENGSLSDIFSLDWQEADAPLVKLASGGAHEPDWQAKP